MTKYFNFRPSSLRTGDDVDDDDDSRLCLAGDLGEKRKLGFCCSCWKGEKKGQSAGFFMPN
jgi:hypothetical protein